MRQDMHFLLEHSSKRLWEDLVIAKADSCFRKSYFMFTYARWIYMPPLEHIIFEMYFIILR